MRRPVRTAADLFRPAPTHGAIRPVPTPWQTPRVGPGGVGGCGEARGAHLVTARHVRCRRPGAARYVMAEDERYVMAEEEQPEMAEERYEKSATRLEERGSSAVLDSAHVGDIQGAFGTIREHDLDTRRSWTARLLTL